MAEVIGCISTKSISLEVAHSIKQKYPEEWPKYMRDRAYREKVRLWLHETKGDDWCDAKAGTCVCTPADREEGELKHQETAVMALFPGSTKELVATGDRKDLS